jgi:trigger factor
VTAESVQDKALDVEVRVEELPKWRRRLAIRVPPSAVGDVRHRHLRELARKAKIKGFRPGRAPEELIEKRFGEVIEREVLEDLLRDAFQAGVRSLGLDPVATPELSNAHWAPDGGLEFTAEVDVRPEVELGRITGFRVEQMMRKIGDADVDRVVERLRHERADWRAVERASSEGDRVVFDSVPLGEDDRLLEPERIKNHAVELGVGTLVPDFEAGLTDRAAGDEATIDVRFPEDHPNAAMRGRSRRFRVTIHAVKERVLPLLDDAFAGTLGDFADLATLRHQIRQNLEQEVAEQSLREVQEALIDEIIAANRIDLPESLVERYLIGMMSDERGPLGRVPEERRADLREILRPGAERALRRYYILRRVAETEGLEADDAAVEAVLVERAREAGLEPGELRRRLERAGDLEDLRLHLTMERVFAWLREHSRITPVEAAGVPA